MAKYGPVWWWWCYTQAQRFKLENISFWECNGLRDPAAKIDYHGQYSTNESVFFLPWRFGCCHFKHSTADTPDIWLVSMTCFFDHFWCHPIWGTCVTWKTSNDRPNYNGSITTSFQMMHFVGDNDKNLIKSRWQYTDNMGDCSCLHVKCLRIVCLVNRYIACPAYII